AKPRKLGLTMALDKNLGLNALDDFLSTAGDHVDIAKMAWGTSRIIHRGVVEEKVRRYRDHGVKVCPGGTLMEIAYLQGVAETALEEAKDMGFNCVEISDGTVRMPQTDKLRLIEKAASMGFEVMSEIGRKNRFEDQALSVEDRVKNALAEMQAGSSRIIMEGREAGSVGIFDQTGSVIPQFVDYLVSHLNLRDVIFEAPHQEQQMWLITHLGNDVNIGNVAPEGCINLETLRLGLRSDTLRWYHHGRSESQA
ncbi:MAG: phosphosulfolactate synthase, partial [Gammaproteobacteria bacterium]